MKYDSVPFFPFIPIDDLTNSSAFPIRTSTYNVSPEIASRNHGFDNNYILYSIFFNGVVVVVMTFVIQTAFVGMYLSFVQTTVTTIVRSRLDYLNYIFTILLSRTLHNFRACLAMTHL